ncbi:MAG: M48 family metalloprotease [Lachnospiraceae bacterium]|nr:M48 family metalloprotease [Lachnospiraceae bacterium]
MVKCFFGLWTITGFWLIQLSSRNKEYDADEFSFKCGYGDALCGLLASFGEGSRKMDGLFAALARSHPPGPKRIARLRALKEKNKRE